MKALAMMVAGLGLLALPAAAQGIEGKWTCTQASGGTEIVSAVEYGRKGKLTHDLRVTAAQGDKTVVFAGRIKGDWAVEGNKLSTRAQKVDVTEATLDGADLLSNAQIKSMMENQLAASLPEMADAVEISLNTGDAMVLGRGDATTSCIRAK